MENRIIRIVEFMFCLIACSSPMKNYAVETPKFSMTHGLYVNPIALTITAGDGDATIYYTTDSSTPTVNSELYTHPLEIDKTTIIKAIAINAEGVITSVATSTYIFPNDVVYQTDTPEGYPSTWGDFIYIEGTAPADYGMDPIMAEDETLKEKIINGLYQLPIVSVSGDKDGFFSHEFDPDSGGIYIYTGVERTEAQLGRGWERPASFEFIGNGDALDFCVNCGVRIHGGNSRIPEDQPKHSFRLHFRTKYGSSKLSYPLFGDDGPSEFDDIIIRSFYNNSWTHGNVQQRNRAQYERDLWIREMQKELGHPSSKGRYCHLFLNGMYWGLYCLTERINGDYCKNNFGGKKSDYDVIKVNEYRNIEAEQGTLDDWNSMLQLLDENTDPYQFYENVSKILDIDNFIDYIILNQYVGNTDWDKHNWVAFKQAGGKFKFICWDSETIFGDVNDDITGVTNIGCPTSIFMKLINNEFFLDKFSSRAEFLLSPQGALNPRKVLEVWNALYSTIENALYDEAARWGDYRQTKHPVDGLYEAYTVDNQYKTERNRLLTDYFPYRTDIYKNQLLNNNWIKNIGTTINTNLYNSADKDIYDMRGYKLQEDQIRDGNIFIRGGHVYLKR